MLKILIKNHVTNHFSFCFNANLLIGYYTAGKYLIIISHSLYCASRLNENARVPIFKSTFCVHATCARNRTWKIKIESTKFKGNKEQANTHFHIVLFIWIDYFSRVLWLPTLFQFDGG